jgi:hypothetical protein
MTSLILVFGLVTAGYVYWIGTHRTEPTLEELLPGSARLTQRQVGVLYGHSGQIVYEWLEDAKRPGAKATMIVIAAAILAYVYARMSLSSDTFDHRS